MFGLKRRAKGVPKRENARQEAKGPHSESDALWKAVRLLNEAVREMDHRVYLLERKRNAEQARTSRANHREPPEQLGGLVPGQEIPESYFRGR